MSTDPVNGYAKYWDVGAMIDHHIINTRDEECRCAAA